MIAEHAHVFLVDKRWYGAVRLFEMTMIDENNQSMKDKGWDKERTFLEISLLSGRGPLSELLGIDSKSFSDRLVECEGRAVFMIDEHGNATLENDNDFGDDKSPITQLNDDKYKGACRQMLYPGVDIKEITIGVTLFSDQWDFMGGSVDDE